MSTRIYISCNFLCLHFTENPDIIQQQWILFIIHTSPYRGKFVHGYRALLNSRIILIQILVPSTRMSEDGRTRLHVNAKSCEYRPTPRPTRIKRETPSLIGLCLNKYYDKNNVSNFFCI